MNCKATEKTSTRTCDSKEKVAATLHKTQYASLCINGCKQKQEQTATVEAKKGRKIRHHKNEIELKMYIFPFSFDFRNVDGWNFNYHA